MRIRTILSDPEGRQRVLIGVFACIVLVGVGFVWYRVFGGFPAPFQSTTQPAPRLIDLDFRVLSDPAFRELGAGQRVIPFPDQVGRQNPFSPSL